MKNYPLRYFIIIALAIGGGISLGYFLDDITQRLPFESRVFPPVIIIFNGCVAGWLVCTTWYGLALRIPLLRRLGFEPTLHGFIFILMWWVFTIIGCLAFFGLNGMDYMTIPDIIAYSGTVGAAYNFVLVVLPLFIFWTIQPALRRLQWCET